MQWIKVTEEFPPENTKVLGIEAQGLSGAELISVRWSKNWGWKGLDYRYDKPLCISYWTHFPAVPEEWER